MTRPDAPDAASSPGSLLVKSTRTSWLRWVGTLVAVGLLIYLLSRQGWAEIASATGRIAWWRFAVALFLVALSRLAVAGRWHTLMRSAGTGITVQQSLRLTFAMLFSSNFLPTTIGGDVVRLVGAIRQGFDQATSIASLFVDRLVGMTGMAMALPFGMPAYLQSLNQLPAGGALSIAWLNPMVRRTQQFLQELTHALGMWLHKPLSLLSALAYTWVHMLCTFGAVWILLHGMGEQISFWLVMGLWSATYFVTLLPISINGMGVQELAMTYFYVTLGGISASNGLTLALLMRVLQMIASLPGALFIPDIMARGK